MTFPLLYLYTTTLDSTLLCSILFFTWYIVTANCRVSTATISNQSHHIKLSFSESPYVHSLLSLNKNFNTNIIPTINSYAST